MFFYNSIVILFDDIAGNCKHWSALYVYYLGVHVLDIYDEWFITETEVTNSDFVDFCFLCLLYVLELNCYIFFL